MSKTLDETIMERALALVETGWTQYAYARTRKGRFVDWRSPEAVSFCAVGAILKAMDDVLGPNQVQSIAHFSKLIASLPSHTLMSINDNTDKEHILSGMRASLEHLRAAASRPTAFNA